MAVEIDSCLVADQSGLQSPAGLDSIEVFDKLEDEARFQGGRVTYPEIWTPGSVDTEMVKNLASLDVMPPFLELEEEPLMSALELQAEQTLGVAAPKWSRIFQARAASRIRRGAGNIHYIVWHTPEGGEPGTLGVLNGVGAGFDVFLPLSRNIHKCNDWWNYIAYQAGNWGYNKVSVGIEIGDYAANSGNWGDAFYKHIATVNAFLAEILGVPTRNGSRGVPGFIDHAEITPGARTDPGARFRREYLLQLIADIRGGRTAPVVAPRPAAASRIDILCEPQTASQPVAKAMEKAFKSVGANYATTYTSTADVRWASYRSRHGRLGENLCMVVGTAVLPRLHPEARQALTNNRDEWYPRDRSDLWKATGQDGTMANQARECIRAYCVRHGKSATDALQTFDRAVQGKAGAR